MITITDKPIFFSICIPSYGYSQYIGDAVKSIYDQNYPDFEIIICDQEDTDSSFLLTKYPGIRIIHLEKPSTYNARCELINAAKGDYYLQLDADDLLETNSLQTLNDVITKTKYADVYVFEKTPNKNYDCSYKFLSKSEFLDMVYVNNKMYYNNLNTKCIKNTNKIAYSPKFMNNNEDCYILLQLNPSFNNYVYINKQLYIFREHSGSFSKTTSYRSLINQADYILLLCSSLEYKYHYQTLTIFLYNFYNSITTLSLSNDYNLRPFLNSKEIKDLSSHLKKHFFRYYKNIVPKKYLLLICANVVFLYNIAIKHSLKKRNNGKI